MNIIENRENEKQMLRCQYAARMFYNRAEKQNDYAWICCIIAWLTIFIPSNIGSEMFLLIVSLLTESAVVILCWRVEKNVATAADLRKYFDSYVFGIGIDQFTELEKRKLNEIALNAVMRDSDVSKIQMANTGRCNPPGVRNWYEFSNGMYGQDAIYECQRQNCWWNNKFIRKRFPTYFILSILLTVCGIYMLTQATSLIARFQIICGSLGLIIRCVERVVKNFQYYRLSLNIDGALEVLTNNRTNDNIETLQEKINERRAIPVLERNRIHKRYANIYSKLYREISRKGKIN